MNGWGTAVRIAYRDALKHKVRSSLVLLLISLPVLVVSSALVIMMTADLNGAEQIERRMGAADAVVWGETDSGEVTQEPDPFNGSTGWSQLRGQVPSAADVTDVLGQDARLVPMQESYVNIRHGKGQVIGLHYTGVDLRDPLAAGLFELAEGRLPTAPDEVVVNEAMRERGYDIGATIVAPGVDKPATVVGVGRDAEAFSGEKALGPVGSLLPVPDARGRVNGQQGRYQWLVDSAPVSWAKVQELNEAGLFVGSRFVLTNPPSAEAVNDDLDPMADGHVSDQAEFIAVAVLVVAMALLEVVLLAGPAFAVTARNHARTLALVTASGGTPAQARRVILAGGLVLGGLATVVGLVLGIVAAWLLMPLAQRASYSWLGPFDVPWLWLAVVGACGLGSAFGAAFVPAWIASRQDPIAVLAGRRADPSPSLRQPILGMALLVAGIAGATIGALNYVNLGSVLLAGSALVAIIGMILTVPLVLSIVARAARALPLPVRYAVRDAARHRTRTVPAVAAVAATVAGVVALGIANASDELENRETYQPMVAMGDAQVSWYSETLPGEEEVDAEQVWDDLQATVARTTPDVEVRRVQVLLDDYTGTTETYTSLRLPGDEEDFYTDHMGSWGSSIMIGDDAMAVRASAAVKQRAEAALADGKVVVFGETAPDEKQIVLSTNTYDYSNDDYEDGESTTESVTLPAEFIAVDQMPNVAALVPTALAQESELDVSTGGLLLRGELDEEAATALEESLRAVALEADVSVERGYERDPWTAIVLWVLAAAGALLMLVGTLTATFLAIADARPDLATLSAVGASPRSRRGVAGSYALLIGGVGAVLGAAVGFVPGVAVSRPLTSAGWNTYGPQGPFLDIPWLMIIAIVVVLPLFTASVVWLSARSRLPMVARID